MAVVDRMMTENDVNRGKRKHDITIVRSEDLLRSLILRWIKCRKCKICVAFTIEV